VGDLGRLMRESRKAHSVMQAGRFPGRSSGGMRLQPSDSQGAPTTGARLTGEFYVDNAGDLYFCKIGGNGKAAKWIKLA
jgi:hypothetical protein